MQHFSDDDDDDHEWSDMDDDTVSVSEAGTVAAGTGTPPGGVFYTVSEKIVAPLQAKILNAFFYSPYLVGHVLGWALFLLTFFALERMQPPAPYYTTRHPVHVDYATTYLGCFYVRRGWITPSLKVKMDEWNVVDATSVAHGVLGYGDGEVYMAKKLEELELVESRMCTYMPNGKLLRGAKGSVAVYLITDFLGR